MAAAAATWLGGGPPVLTTFVPATERMVGHVSEGPRRCLDPLFVGRGIPLCGRNGLSLHPPELGSRFLLARHRRAVLEFALIVILGAGFGQLLQASSDARIAAEEDRAKRLEFLCRLLPAHVQVAHAQKLMRIHDSGRTYGEQHRALIRTSPILDWIFMDLREARNLVGEDHEAVAQAVEDLIEYLRAAKRSMSDVTLRHRRRSRPRNEALRDERNRVRPDLDAGFRTGQARLPAGLGQVDCWEGDDEDACLWAGPP